MLERGLVAKRREIGGFICCEPEQRSSFKLLVGFEHIGAFQFVSTFVKRLLFCEQPLDDIANPSRKRVGRLVRNAR